MVDDEPTEVVRAVYEAIERGDHPAVTERFGSDVRWQQAARAVPAAGSQLHGPAEPVEQVLRPFEDDWDGFTEERHRVRSLGATVVVEGVYRGRYRPTGRLLEAEFCHLWTVRDGRVVDFRQFTDTAAFHETMAQE
jgi:uncharacterized protein